MAWDPADELSKAMKQLRALRAWDNDDEDDVSRDEDDVSRISNKSHPKNVGPQIFMGGSGSNYVGGDAINSPFGPGASATSRDINVSRGLDPELKLRLDQARDAIGASKLPRGDKGNAMENLERLRGELERPEPDRGRICRLFDRIQEVLPYAASILASAAKLAGLLRG